MDYGRIIKDAFLIAWQRRYLWVFGFFAGASLPNLNNKITSSKATEFFSWLTPNPGALVIFIFTGLCVLLIFWLLQVVSHGSLVSGVADIESGQPAGFEQALSSGLRNFWKVLGLHVLLLLFLLLILTLLLLPFLIMVVSNNAGLMVAGIAWLVLMSLPALLAILLACLFWNYSLCFTILQGRGVTDSVKESWRLMRGRPSESFILFIISLGMSMAIAVGLMVAIVVLALPFIFIGLLNKTLGLVLGLLIEIPFVIFITCLSGVYGLSYWTLGFMRLSSLNTERVITPAS